MKSCPFCGSDKLDVSMKGNHTCIFCTKCHTYGPRVIEYGLPESKQSWKMHWFKNLKDMKANSDGDKYHPYFINKTNEEIQHSWYEEEAARLWDKRASSEEK